MTFTHFSFFGLRLGPFSISVLQGSRYGRKSRAYNLAPVYPMRSQKIRQFEPFRRPELHFETLFERPPADFNFAKVNPAANVWLQLRHLGKRAPLSGGGNVFFSLPRSWLFASFRLHKSKLTG